jgi:pimeloyl-ACP methyl ester carboxylesterase
MRKIIKAAGIVLLSYGCIAIGFYLLQDKIIFQPDRLPMDHSFTFSQPYREYFIPTTDGESLNALLFNTSQPSRGLLLYFHGNADNLQRWGDYAVDFNRLGYDVIMVDYRGFGKSTGKPTEKNLYADAITLLQWAQTNVPHSRLIIYGRSLGSAVASHLATKVTPALLILETPFDEMKGVIYPLFRPFLYIIPERHKFSNKENLLRVKSRKVIIHGTDDWVVPLSSAMMLKPLLGTHDQFVMIEGGGHKNLRDFELYHNTLKEVLLGIER